MAALIRHYGGSRQGTSVRNYILKVGVDPAGYIERVELLSRSPDSAHTKSCRLIRWEWASGGVPLPLNRNLGNRKPRLLYCAARHFTNSTISNKQPLSVVFPVLAYLMRRT